jgi:hypothetical protein
MKMSQLLLAGKEAGKNEKNDNWYFHVNSAVFSARLCRLCTSG